MGAVADQIVEAIGHEVNVIRHLGTKLTADRLDWRPTEPQRSLGELMRYLTYTASIGVLAAVNGNWDHGDGLHEASEKVTLETFDAAMQAQQKLIADTLAPLSDDDLTTRRAQLPWGQACTLLRALLDMGPKVIAAYRMQFFLYLKQSGLSELDSANCWVGIDRPKQADG